MDEFFNKIKAIIKEENEKQKKLFSGLFNKWNFYLY